MHEPSPRDALLPAGQNRKGAARNMSDPVKISPAVSASVVGEGLLKKEQVAERLGVAARTVGDWSRAGKLPVIRMGARRRFRWADIEALLLRQGGIK